ncbi:hypothetical protein [Ensifer sp. LBL]|uniref:hypothetical protein n=1 Tax=Ensifer sp. LBL TaxID=2991056 RepID=UPI003D1D5193
MTAVLRNVVATARRYADHPDPRVACANTIALLVASNQPFYPLYVLWAVRQDITPVWFTFFSTPFFLAVPALSRRSGVAGRVLLPLTGIANTVLSAWLFGVASAVEIFLIPCSVIALLLFRPSERAVAFTLAGLALVAFLFLHEVYGAPMIDYTAQEYAALARLNAISAAMLTGFVALVFSNRLAEAERSAEAVGDQKSG